MLTSGKDLVTADPEELMRQAPMTAGVYISAMRKETEDPVAMAILALVCAVDYHTATMARRCSG